MSFYPARRRRNSIGWASQRRGGGLRAAWLFLILAVLFWKGFFRFTSPFSRK